MNRVLSATSPRRQAFFLDTPRGALFCLATWPATPPRGGLLQVPPFAEEMNKARRMTALAAQHFAAQGWLVLQVDLMGTGDSGGDFADATWIGWQEDVGQAGQWLETQLAAGESALPRVPRVLWGLRTGALLAAACSARPGTGWQHWPLLLWQPVLSGSQFLTQFLRLKMANEMLAEGDGRQVMKDLKAALAAGQSVEVAGYGLHPELASGLAAATLDFNPGQPVHVFELPGAERSEPTPALALAHQRWLEAGVVCQVETVAGAAFWSTQEIAEVPALIAASARALERLLDGEGT